MRALKIKATTNRSAKWPAICVLLVVFQWFAWHHVGLNAGYLDGWLSPHETTVESSPPANEFEVERASDTTAAASAEFCQELSDWPLRGCGMG